MTKLKDLKKAYEKAVKDKVETFFIEDHELVVGYAKYLIKYLEEVGKLKDEDSFTLKPRE